MRSPLKQLRSDLDVMVSLGGLACDIEKMAGVSAEEVLQWAVRKSIACGKPVLYILTELKISAFMGEKIAIEEEPMSESREHKRRYNQRLQYIAEFEKWLASEPPMIRLISWARWKKRRPVWEETL